MASSTEIDAARARLEQELRRLQYVMGLLTITHAGENSRGILFDVEEFGETKRWLVPNDTAQKPLVP